MNAIGDIMVDEVQDDHEDLGESADLGASSHASDPSMKEAITKAKEKAKIQMDASIKNSQLTLPVSLNK